MNCPIEGHGPWCPCTAWHVKESDLGVPFGVMVARCPNGHHEVGGPKMLHRGNHSLCALCGGVLEPIHTAILNPVP